MTKSKRLKPVIKIARDNELRAAKEMGIGQQAVKQRQARLEELNSYKLEYQQRFQSVGATRAALQTRDYLVFLRRLDQVIVEQQKLVEHAVAELSLRRQNWLALRTRADALEKVTERYRLEENEHAERREQRETDERSQRTRSTYALDDVD